MTINNNIDADIKPIIDNSSIDNSNIDMSTKFIINNIYVNERKNLEERFDGREYEYYFFVNGLYSENHPKYDDHYSVTCTSIHDGSYYMTDHLHAAIPKRFYDDLIFKNRIYHVKAIVHEYIKSGKKSYSLRVTDVLGRSHRIPFIKFSLNYEQTPCLEDRLNYEDISYDRKYTLLQRQLSYFDAKLSDSDFIKFGFITNTILLTYFINIKV